MKKDKITSNKITSAELLNIFNSALRNRQEVIQFGQTIPNPNLLNRPDTIDTALVLKDLADYYDCSNVYDLTGFDMYGLDIESIFEVKEISHHNTYNWSAPLTNDLDYKTYINVREDKAYIEVNVQNGYGDVRGGYNLSFLFEFTDLVNVQDFSLPGILFDYGQSAFSSFTIEAHEGIEVEFNFDMFKEGGTYNVYAPAIDFEDYDSYIGTYQDCVDYANRLVHQHLNLTE